MDSFTVTLCSDEEPYVRFTCDAIRIDGGICLVPEWTYSPDGVDRSPVRLIRLLDMPLERAEGLGGGYVLRTPLPRSVLAGQIPAALDGKVEAVYIPLKVRAPGRE
ncbi:hypothetical protein Y5W_00557 [Alcanivorax sp. 521-1]|uniref:Uncharacterized protein n=1 Tax=Alloalcanivorax profundimaris TaxID=2735259 RepID=A0ABS0AMA1_9GAMM|nr:hypothetical protein [Alloalcanivorax profundimaris]MBF5055263.1 hypothetical protein [Alloalcanivorax profundimaris]